LSIGCAWVPEGLIRAVEAPVGPWVSGPKGWSPSLPSAAKSYSVVKDPVGETEKIEPSPRKVPFAVCAD
jgi:hypothetical protein